jgi:hypothetical protein
MALAVARGVSVERLGPAALRVSQDLRPGLPMAAGAPLLAIAVSAHPARQTQCRAPRFHIASTRHRLGSKPSLTAKITSSCKDLLARRKGFEPLTPRFEVWCTRLERLDQFFDRSLGLGDCGFDRCDQALDLGRAALTGQTISFKSSSCLSVRSPSRAARRARSTPSKWEGVKASRRWWLGGSRFRIVRAP